MSQTWHADPLAEEQLSRNFCELLPPLGEAEAHAEASRCLYCYDAPCSGACPTHIDVPEFIRRIAQGNLKGSARTIVESNFLGATCARVCPVDELCEGACVINARGGRPIAIGRLQRHATDYMTAHNLQLVSAGTPRGKKVAVVGGGPAGLSCSAHLARMGYEVTLFEKRELAGGLDTYGIVIFREPMDVSLREVEMVRALGVATLTGIEVGRTVTAEELMDRYDALFLGLGRGLTSTLGIPGEEFSGVVDALEFIESTRLRALGELRVGRRVAVIGAGNTAVDAAAIARRLGAEEVSILYRRGEAEMTAYRFEYEFARREGIVYRFHTSPIRILGDGRVRAIECVRTTPGEPDASGRRSPVPVPGSEFIAPADQVIRATPQRAHMGLVEALGLSHRGGRILVDPATGQTSVPKVFAGGDCILEVGSMAATVVAVQHGKVAAGGIHRMLSGAGAEERPGGAAEVGHA